MRADNIMPQGHALPPGTHMAQVDMAVILTEPSHTETVLYTTLSGTELQAEMLNSRRVAPSGRLRFGFTLDKCHLFDAATGPSLRV
jgi:multiple sugar transport system ATP-binding protein